MIFRYENWHEGDACPNCGSRTIRRIVIYEDLLKSDNERLYEIDIEKNNVLQKKYICDGCEEILLKSPARKERD